MTENQVFSSVQALRAMIANNYNRTDWCYLPGPNDQNAIIKLNIYLQNIVDNGKKGRLLACELLSTALGWNPGTMAEALYGRYEELKKKLGRGFAEAAFEEIRREARRIWGLGSTKHLWLAEIYGLIEWLEQHNGVAALKAILQDPRGWHKRLARLNKVKRPRVIEAPLPEGMVEADVTSTATPEELWGPAFDEEEVPFW